MGILRQNSAEQDEGLPERIEAEDAARNCSENIALEIALNKFIRSETATVAP